MPGALQVPFDDYGFVESCKHASIHMDTKQMPEKSHNKAIAIVLLSILATACGGSSSNSSDTTIPENDGGNDGSDGSDGGDGGDGNDGSDGFIVDPQPSVSGSYRYFGYVDISLDSFEDRVNHDSNFFKMVSVADAKMFKTIPPPPDQCRLRITDSIPTDAAAIGFPTQPFELVSAGETMTLSSASNTYADVVFTGSRFEIGPYPAPDELTLDLPGMEFPAFANVNIPCLDRSGKSHQLIPLRCHDRQN